MSAMLIEVHELQQLIETGEVVVFDCRFSLAAPSQGFEDYLAGHIPGAHYLHLEHDLSAPVQEHGGRHPLPDMDEFGAKAAQAGVTQNKPVVVYDAGTGMATRAWWLLEYIGHPDVRVLNGGWTAWANGGLAVSQEIPAPDASDFIPHLVGDKTVSVTDVEEIVAGHQPSILVDARAGARYRGEVEPLDKVAGHIPGALNAPWDVGVDEQGKWRGTEAQQGRFAASIAANKPLVMYCGSGVTACANLFALRLAGVKDAKLYPGSWSDWSSYPEHPVETGEVKDQD